jgi:uncharacterized protein (UPF0264 family)
MQLLVSVTCADEAVEALRGGAHVIDAKDPSAGALGAVRPEVFSEIRAAVGERTIVSAALGDAGDVAELEQRAAELAVRGARFVKVGFANIATSAQAAGLVERAVCGCASAGERTGVVAVAYADASRAGAVDAWTLVRVAADTGAHGVLIDTADKSGARLTESWTTSQLAEWVAAAHELGLQVAVAGKLGLDDLDVVLESGADMVGVRGAACIGGRTGRVSAERVRALRASLTRNDSSLSG